MPTGELRKHETALLWSIRGGIVAVLCTPLVVTTSTVYPFVVGKALYSRAIIEVVVGLWALLLLTKPQFRPPRSWLLALLAAGLAWSLVASLFGVSFQRSMWSDYQRMAGWIDALHWFAFIVVVVSVFRNVAAMRTVLNLHLGVGLAVASSAVLLALARAFELPLPMPEREVRRIGGLLGNANYLGAYCVGNALIALGFLTSSLVDWRKRERAPADAGKRQRQGRQPVLAALGLRWTFWLLTTLLSLWALAASGSFTSAASLGFAFLILAGAGVWLAKTSIGRRAAIVALAVAATAGAVSIGVTTHFVATLPTDVDSMASYRAYREDTPAGGYVSNAQRLATVQRVEAIEAGLVGLAARPWLGWGPENFIVVWGRAVDREAADLEIHDSAHSKIIDEGAGKGVLGVVVYLAPWAFAFFLLVRKVGRARTDATADDGNTVFLVFVTAALGAIFAQSQTLFDSAALTLQQLLLFAFVVHAAPAVLPQPARLPWRLPFSLRLPLAIGCVALAGFGLATNRTIHAAASQVIGVGEPGRPAAHFERAIGLFEPLAFEPRMLLFRNLANKWDALRISDGAEARRLLLVAKHEGERALAAEPENWVLHHVLAHLYETVMKTEPEYAPLARHHRERGTALAPLVMHRS